MPPRRCSLSTAQWLHKTLLLPSTDSILPAFNHDEKEGRKTAQRSDRNVKLSDLSVIVSLADLSLLHRVCVCSEFGGGHRRRGLVGCVYVSVCSRLLVRYVCTPSF